MQTVKSSLALVKSAFILSAAIGLTACPYNPGQPDPGECESGLGSVHLSNGADEAVHVTISDDLGVMEDFILADDEEAALDLPPAIYQLAAAGQTSSRTVLSQALNIRCDEVTEITFAPLPRFKLDVSVSGTGQGNVSSAPAGIDCNVAETGEDCAENYLVGTEVTLTAVTQGHSQFVGWSGACAASPPDACTITMDQAQTVGAQFVPIEDTYVVALAGTGQGTVTSVPNVIECSNDPAELLMDCSTDLERGSEITLVANPATGSQLVGFGDADLDCLPSSVAGLTCVLEVNEARTVTVTFDRRILSAPLISSMVSGQEDQGQVAIQGMNYYIATNGLYPSRTGLSLADIPWVGEIRLFANNFAPSGWIPCEGQILPISTNTALFSLLGTTFGGDGRTTFGVPDLRARVAMGVGTIDNASPVAPADGDDTVPLISSISLGQKSQGQVQALGIRYVIARSGIYPSRTGPPAAPSEAYLGQLKMFAGNFAPGGWADCDGSLLSISSDTALFSLLGTMYGGDGRTNFALPDLRGRVPMGLGSLVGTIPPVTPDQIPLIESITWGGTATGQIGVTGINHLIARSGVFPSRSGSTTSSGPMISEILMFAGNFAPAGWSQAEAQLLPISGNEALFSLVGTIYGGDGRTNFGLPDLRARVPMHSGTRP